MLDQLIYHYQYSIACFFDVQILRKEHVYYEIHDHHVKWIHALWWYKHQLFIELMMMHLHSLTVWTDANIFRHLFEHFWSVIFSSYKLLIKSCKFQEYKNVLYRLELKSASDYVNMKLFHLNISSLYHESQKDNFIMIESAFQQLDIQSIF